MVGLSVGAIFLVHAVPCIGLPTIWDRRSELFGDKYNPDEPPPNMANEPLLVTVGMNLRHVHYDIISGLLEVKAWYRLMWKDDRLLYSGEDWFGEGFRPKADYIPMDVVDDFEGKVWVPDVYVTEASDFQAGFGDGTMLQVMPQESIMLHNESAPWNVYWIRPGTFNAYCKDRDFRHFPFDVQTCRLTFESWSYDAARIQVEPAPGKIGFDSKVGVSGNEYALILGDVTIKQNVAFYANTNSSYTSVVVELKLARLPGFYVFNAILPMGMMLVLSELTFWIPINPDYGGAGERISYAAASLLTIVAILIFTTAKRPMVRENTWLDLYQSRTIALAFVPILQTAMVFSLERTFSDVGTAKDMQKLGAPVSEEVVDEDWLIINGAQEEEVEHSQAGISIWSHLYEISGGWVSICPRNLDRMCHIVYPVMCLVCMEELWRKIPVLAEEQRMEGWIFGCGYGVIFFAFFFLVVVALISCLSDTVNKCRETQEPHGLHWRYSRSRRVQSLQQQQSSDTYHRVTGVQSLPSNYRHVGDGGAAGAQDRSFFATFSPSGRSKEEPPSLTSTVSETTPIMRDDSRMDPSGRERSSMPLFRKY